jgi:hypothetical protein
MKKMIFTKLMVIAGLLCVAGDYAPAQVLTDFADHGIAAKASESRGVLAVRDQSGTPLIVAIAQDQYGTGARCSLLVIDAKTGKTQQYWFQKPDQSTGDAYSVMRTPEGKIYTGFNDTFVEFDLEKREWTYNSKIDGFPMAFTRTPDGNVYFGTFSTSWLYRFNPATRVLDKLIQLDPEQKYPTYLEAGPDGWVYAGIGTARANIVAYNPQTGERKQLLDEATRKAGTSYVFASTDGNLYAREFSADSGRLLRLSGGTAAPVEGNPPNPRRLQVGAINWGNQLRAFPDGGEIVSFSVADKSAEVFLDGKKERITFDYESNGAGIITLITGPDNKLYGSTRHPMHLFTWDPTKSTLVDNGGIPAVAGGNFGAFGVNGKYLVGDTYSFGELYEYDTSQPWNAPLLGASVNPRVIGKFGEVSRPRASVTLPNGDILISGFPAYGFTGGGLVTYDAKTRETRVKPAAELIPNQSTVAMEMLNDQTVVGGTSIETPGGGAILAKEAELYLMDAATQKVTFRIVPVPGARTIADVHVAPDGKVYGLTDMVKFFVFDPQTKKVIYTADWLTDTKWSQPFNPGNALWNAPNGRVGALFPKVMLEVQPDYSIRKLADMPEGTGAGAVVLNNRLYFGTGSHLQSVGLSELGKKN